MNAVQLPQKRRLIKRDTWRSVGQVLACLVQATSQIVVVWAYGNPKERFIRLILMNFSAGIYPTKQVIAPRPPYGGPHRLFWGPTAASDRCYGLLNHRNETILCPSRTR
jgi:hypothetical protein